MATSSEGIELVHHVPAREVAGCEIEAPSSSQVSLSSSLRSVDIDVERAAHSDIARIWSCCPESCSRIARDSKPDSEHIEGLTRIEAVLGLAGFSAEPGSNGWRWRGIVDGFAVKLEFLCDLDVEPEGIVTIPGCRVLRANNLRGTVG